MRKDPKAIERLLALKARSKERSYVKDGDLQIQTPPSPEGTSLENAMAFKNIYTHYMNEKESASLKTDVKSEMEEAENSFNSMMELHKSIIDAYQELVHK